MKQLVGCFRDAEEKALAEAEGHLMYRVAWLHTHDHQHMSSTDCCRLLLGVAILARGLKGRLHLNSMREFDAA